MNKFSVENEYKLTETGEVDISYYISKGHNLRNEAIRNFSVNAVEKVKAALASLVSPLFQVKTA